MAALVSDNQPPVIVQLPSISPALALEVLPHGLTINRFLVNGDGRTNDLLVGPFDPIDHEKYRKFLNPIVGRYSNRLPAGDVPFEKDGVSGVVSPISNESPTVSLHGGPVGFDRHIFAPIALTASSLFSAPELRTISDSLPGAQLFSFSSPAGDQGFPGALEVEVLMAGVQPVPLSLPSPLMPNIERVRAIKDIALGSIVLVYRARVKEAEDGKKVVTPVNLTQHWGFNLDASVARAPEGAPDVKDHRLTIQADHILELDSVGLATGNLVPVQGTTHDHRTAGPTMGERWREGGYDSYYLFAPREAQHPIHVPLKDFESQNFISDLIAPLDVAAQGTKKPVTTLSSAKSGVTLDFYTNQPGVQFYTGIGMDGTGTRKPIHGGSVDAKGYDTQSAAFLEFHEPLASWLHSYKTKPGVTDTLLTSEDLYHNWVRVDVTFTQEEHRS
ncbi:hypothetical protein BOTBODRAFT_37725 [Botryobasidium botryosum FD-172 SS1]|uniref:Galactose mutarotase-like protein n=1 Tax=Botryobasidium botryosum (strain FD-172 SS1) TaxID=930990 RepID=A0A067M1Z0_BOTB1|nr:hypothetical protein BOTBODRAFT_37725 [Botryobasidium botryosum FD-172 SS1]